MDIFNPLASVIIFQHNPKELTRGVEAQTSEVEETRSEVLRLTGAAEKRLS